jgi:ABC-type proline/glycine betaine transport system permease subunit
MVHFSGIEEILLALNLTLCFIGFTFLSRTLTRVAKREMTDSPDMKFILYLLRTDLVWSATKSISLFLHFFIYNIDNFAYWITDTITLACLGVSVSFAVIISFCAKAPLQYRPHYSKIYFKLFLTLGLGIPITGVMMYRFDR